VKNLTPFFFVVMSADQIRNREEAGEEKKELSVPRVALSL